MALLYWLGVLIGFGSAAAFAALGLLALYGAARTTREQIIPGFRPDRPGPAQRALTLAAVWTPAAVVGAFGLYAGVHILGITLAAL